jgi:hypothetical protein
LGAVSLHTLLREGIAGGVALDAGAVADIAIHADRLFQARDAYSADGGRGFRLMTATCSGA